MAWIESHTTMRTHKKLKPLCEALKISRPTAIGHLHLLWWWAIENREDGDLSGLFDHDIAVACDWSGNPGALIKALHDTGWLLNYRIKDWDDYSYRLLHMRKSNRERQKRHRNESVTRDVTGYVPPATIPNLTKPIKNKVVLTDSKFLESLETNPAYKDIDIKTELSKMDAWLLTHPGRQKTRRFIVGWLNRKDKVMDGQPKRASVPFPSD